MTTTAQEKEKRLLANYQYYLDNYDKFVGLYDGKVLVLVDCRVTDTCDSEEQAYALGSEKYGLGNFIFQRCSGKQKTYTSSFHSIRAL